MELSFQLQEDNLEMYVPSYSLWFAYRHVLFKPSVNPPECCTTVASFSMLTNTYRDYSRSIYNSYITYKCIKFIRTYLRA